MHSNFPHACALRTGSDSNGKRLGACSLTLAAIHLRVNPESVKSLLSLPRRAGIPHPCARCFQSGLKCADRPLEI